MIRRFLTPHLRIGRWTDREPWGAFRGRALRFAWGPLCIVIALGREHAR